MDWPNSYRGKYNNQLNWAHADQWSQIPKVGNWLIEKLLIALVSAFPWITLHFPTFQLNCGLFKHGKRPEGAQTTNATAEALSEFYNPISYKILKTGFTS